MTTYLALRDTIAAQLLGDAVDSAAAAVLYEESGGNPFYLEQLARISDGATQNAPGGAVSVSGLRMPAMVGL